MIYQRLATGSPQAEKLVGLVMYGLPMVPGWSFGDVVMLQDLALAQPTLAGAVATIPHLADVTLEV